MKSLETTNKPIQYLVVDFLGNNVRSQFMQNSSIEDKCYYIFYNFRISNSKPKGLRLTTKGNTLLKKFFQYYEFELNESLNGNAVLSLDKHMTYPYYLDQHTIVFFNQSDAGWFKLSGSLNTFAKNI